MTSPKNSAKKSSPQSSKLFDMLSDLAKNPDKVQEFNENPSQVLDEYEIEEELKALLMSKKNWNKFTEAVQKEAEKYGLKAP
ncbi:hypothetical protein J0895_16095 [Phormidium pseudopriestleyi FRX01]|uniref:Uncharacterized protein n=1 Tax=Phormidium pseudopriestleyi FRX01 TaxID=1759528 RepID=A0ABS3FUZ0_9CYAN|nr:hypothetical protein [Phormidium pseudopriestleyi]MBO0350588.1 hypothetical protein [Phormidium pseudopriestleyi FRX01]